jgi:hypothetical protein
MSEELDRLVYRDRVKNLKEFNILSKSELLKLRDDSEEKYKEYLFLFESFMNEVKVEKRIVKITEDQTFADLTPIKTELATQQEERAETAKEETVKSALEEIDLDDIREDIDTYIHCEEIIRESGKIRYTIVTAAQIASNHSLYVNAERDLNLFIGDPRAAKKLIKSVSAPGTLDTMYSFPAGDLLSTECYERKLKEQVAIIDSEAFNIKYNR